MPIRILADPKKERGAYHVFSRTIGAGARKLEEDEREYLKNLIHKYAEAFGVDVLTYTIMPNHFHILASCPSGEIFQPKLTADDLFRRFEIISSKTQMDKMRIGYELACGMQWEEEFLDRYRRRCYNLSAFAGEIKQTFARWHNKKHGIQGPVWNERFRSVYVQDDPEIIGVMAAYIDNNPVRAGLADDPADWRWNGYAEAMAGSEQARRGLLRILQREERLLPDWAEFQGWYRQFLHVRGLEHTDEHGNVTKRGYSEETLRDVLANDGRVPILDLVKYRVRYFTESLAFGTEEFVRDIFARYREKMGVAREEGARVPRDVELGEWRTLKDLRGDVTNAPAGQ